MEFLKRNVFVIACLVAGLVSVGLGLTACSRFKQINTDMEQAVTFGGDLKNAGRVQGRSLPVRPVDLAILDVNRDNVQAQFKKVQERILDINRGEVKPEYILEAAFPDYRNRPDIRYEFVQRYREKLKALPEILKAKGPPTTVDEEAMKAEMAGTTGEVSPMPETRRPVPARPAAPMVAPARDRDREEGNRALGEALRTLGPSRVQPTPQAQPSARPRPGERPPLTELRKPEETLKMDPHRRAVLKRASEIYCYIGNSLEETFTIVPDALDVQARIPPGELWRAQVTLWIQQEICRALARVNDEAAKQLGKATTKPDSSVNVTVLPVKRLIRLAVGDYRVPAGSGREGGGAGAPPRSGRSSTGGGLFGTPPPEPSRTRGGGFGLGAALSRTRGAPPPEALRPSAAVSETATNLMAELNGRTWTGRQSGPQLDVVPVALDLVLDLRFLGRVIDRICTTNLYVPTRVSYRVLDRADLSDRYVYGPDPVVHATLFFERYFLPEIYAREMPLEVAEMLGHIPVGEGAGTRPPGQRESAAPAAAPAPAATPPPAPSENRGRARRSRGLEEAEE
jgi:hypothetical protein